MSEVDNAGSPSLRNTVFLQAAAAVLIANSHLEAFYPRAWMAADGFIGNSMFFMLSGYGITRSLLTKEQTFVQYYVRRIFRIYPVLWLVEILFHFLMQGAWKSARWQDYVEILVYPTSYGFVRQIMVFYVLFYFLKHWLRRVALLSLIAVLCVPLVGIYAYDICRNPMERLQLGSTNEWLWWVFFFQIMLLGSCLAVPDRKPYAAGGLRSLVLLSLCFSAYVSLKLLMVMGVNVPWAGFTFSRLYPLLFLLIPPMLYYSFVLGTAASWLETMAIWRPVRLGIALVGGLTLEIYMGVTRVPAAFSVNLGKVLELS